MRARRRERGQVLVLAAVFMVALVGAMALVIDAGMFLIIQRQFQSAADAGALAGAWHDPICPVPAALCLGPTQSAEAVAKQVAQVNGDQVADLCGGTVTVTVPTLGTPLNVPAHVNAIVVTVECNAGYSFGRILPGLTTRHISASAAAAVGDRNVPTTDPSCNPQATAGGDITDFEANPPCGRVARLLD